MIPKPKSKEFPVEPAALCAGSDLKSW